jgi:hypothetical protein
MKILLFEQFINEATKTYKAYVIYTKEDAKILVAYPDKKGTHLMDSFMDDNIHFVMVNNKKEFDDYVKNIKDNRNFKDIKEY